MAKKSKTDSISNITSNDDKSLSREAPTVPDDAESSREKSSNKSKKVKDRLHSAIGWPMKDVPAILMLYYITDTMQGTPKLAIFLAFSMYRKVSLVINCSSIIIAAFSFRCTTRWSFQ
jgi:hypothetical protein